MNDFINPLSVASKHDARIAQEKRSAQLRKNPWEKCRRIDLTSRDTFKFTPKGEHCIVLKIENETITYTYSLNSTRVLTMPVWEDNNPNATHRVFIFRGRR